MAALGDGPGAARGWPVLDRSQTGATLVGLAARGPMGCSCSRRCCPRPLCPSREPAEKAARWQGSPLCASRAGDGEEWKRDPPARCQPQDTPPGRCRYGCHACVWEAVRVHAGDPAALRCQEAGRFLVKLGGPSIRRSHSGVSLPSGEERTCWVAGPLRGPHVRGPSGGSWQPLMLRRDLPERHPKTLPAHPVLGRAAAGPVRLLTVTVHNSSGLTLSPGLWSLFSFFPTFSFT